MEYRFDPIRTSRAARGAMAAAITFTLAACGSGGSNDTANASAGTDNLTAVSAGNVNSATKSQSASSSKDADKTSSPGATTGTTNTPGNTAVVSPATVAPASTAAAAVTAVPTGRLLASNCFQCHGTNGVSTGGFEKLAGMGAGEIANEMKEMASSGEKGVMHVMALGFTTEQAWQLATYFSTQR